MSSLSESLPFRPSTLQDKDGQDDAPALSQRFDPITLTPPGAPLAARRTVFVVEDPKRGDFANVLAIGDLIASRLQAQIAVKRIAPRAKFLLPLLQAMLRAASRYPALRRRAVRRLLQTMLFNGAYAGDAAPLAIVSTLGRGEAQGAFLASFWDAPCIHLGSPKRLASRHFAAVIAHAGDPPRPGEIALPIAPTRMRLPGGPQQGAAIRHVLLLLGGDAAGVARYRSSFWERCVAIAARTADACQARLTLSTSPRTGAAVEDRIARACAQLAAPPGQIFYGRGDRSDLALHLADADLALVTAESVSMISDAIASGARVIALYDGELPGSERVRAFLRQQAAAGRLKLIDAGAWRGAPLCAAGLRPLSECWSDLLWRRLAAVLAPDLAIASAAVSRASPRRQP
jgi:mitochondrial fission protein ELM1